MEVAPSPKPTNAQIAEIKARLKILNEYTTRLEVERADWLAVVKKYEERHSAMEARSKGKNMQKIEAKVGNLLDDVGHRPEHILTKTFSKFQESMGNSADKLRQEIAALKADCSKEKQFIEIVEKRHENLCQIINERSEEDFAKKVDIWTRARAFTQKNLSKTTQFMESVQLLEKEIGTSY